MERDRQGKSSQTTQRGSETLASNQRSVPFYFDGGYEFGLSLPIGQHGFIPGFEGFGSRFSADGDIVADGAQAMQGIDISINGFSRNATGKINGVHSKCPLNRGE
jgi:hypothetical protein